MARIKTFALLVFALLIAGVAGITCSSSTKPIAAGATGTGGGAGSGAGTVGTGGTVGTVADAGALTSCATSVIKVVFAPMYSAYESTHTYQIPAVVNGIDESVVTWSASDPTMVDLATDTTTGGVMITVQKAGTVNIIASAGTLCGSSTLTITDATADDWTAGSQRYNDGVVLRRVPGTGPGGGGPGGPGAGANADGGVATDAATDAALPTQAACTNCHGDTATLLQFKTVAHTPEQTGGFSDEQLQNIFMNGMIPDGGYFDPSIVTYAQWQSFHKWDMTADEAKGIIVYLRSLTPTAQTGTSNFGGQFDGGVRGGGGGRRGGGMMGAAGAPGAGGAGGDTGAAGAGGAGGATGP